MGARGHIYIGTCGWSYAHWTGVLYPPGTSARDRLGLYARTFPTVEVDASFYRMPSEDALRAWRLAVPTGFRFAVKGNRLVTHYKRLADAGAEVRRFMERIGALGPAATVVLWQLPPSLARDDARLEGFLRELPRHGPLRAVEFRHASWLDDAVFDLLRRHGVASVHVSSARMPRDFTVTAGFVYARLHGLPESGFDYTPSELAPWAEFLREQAAEGLDGFVYFNNDAGGCAPRNALTLIEMLGEAAYPWPEMGSALLRHDADGAGAA
jgi:uncharacterized protein YecE (DUF72 family)